MARILGNPYGELRGTIAGTTFSRNRAGQFARAYVKPAQANTGAQIAARSSFGQASQAFATLTESNKGTYESFAVGPYNPLKVTNVGQMTGQNAFISIYQSVSTSNRKALTTVYQDVGGGTPIAHTNLFYAMPNFAPTVSVQAAVKSPGGFTPQPLEAGNLEFRSNGELDLTIFFGNNNQGIAAGQMVDPNNKRFGISFYISDPYNTPNGRPKNKFYNFMGSCPIPSFTTALASGVLGLDMFVTGIDFSTNKANYSVGQFATITVLAVGQDGTIATIGNVLIIVQ